MKRQLVTITTKKHGIDIKRELFDACGLVDMAFCSIRTTKNGFVASGFRSIYKPTITHDVTNSSESIDDFLKAVFSK